VTGYTKKVKNMSKYYIQPPIDIYSSEESHYYKEYKTYAEYNYLRPGLVSYIKTRHFELSLRLTRDYFDKCNVIDFGCADGVFLPSLAKYFTRVVAIDRVPGYIERSSKLVSVMGLNNVELICNDTLTISDVMSKISREKYHILYLLEILEHIGDKSHLYESKINFLKEVSNLIDENGLIVISVPKMIGIPFLIQRIALAITRSRRESISPSDLFKACFLNDTTGLEKQWNGQHLGFNHRKLESYLKNEFRLLKKRDLLFQVVYVIKKCTLPNTA